MRFVPFGLGGAAVVVTLVVAPVNAQQRVGTTGAVNPAAQSAPPGGALRTMNVGGNVVFKERINTSDSGSVQLVFVDRTTMNIGPNSQLTIDEFVYDPAANTGRMTATLTKGVMRFVGGQASHTGGATIKTPATTLGVRGGVVTVRHDQQNGTRAINHFGIMTAQTANGFETIRRPGFALNVTSANQPPSPPTKAPQTEIDGNNRQLTSAQGQTGGRRQTPTDASASKAVGESNSQVTTSTVSGQQQTTQQATQTTTNQPVTTATSDTLQLIQQTASTGGQQQVVSTLPTIAPATVKLDPPRRFYTLLGYPIIGELIPTAFRSPGNPQGDGIIVGFGAGGKNPDGTTNLTSRFMSSSITINGSGSGQTSTIVGVWGAAFQQGAEYVVNGGVRGTTRLNSTNSMGRLGAGLASVTGGVTVDSDYSPTSVTIDQNFFLSDGSRSGDTGFFYPGGGPPGQTYSYVAGAARTANRPDLGGSRPVVDLYGVAGGLMRTDSLTSNTFNGPSFPVWGDTYINLEESSRFNSSIQAFRLGTSTATSDNFSDMNSKFGYRGGTTQTRSAYVDYNNFIAADAYTQDNVTPISTVNSQGITLDRSLFVNVTRSTAMSLFPGVNFCNCEYTRWGFWSSEKQRIGVNNSGAPDPVRDRLHMGTWTAGVPTTHIEVPTTGTATYAGHIIGSFKTGSSEYIAAGNFQNAVNFGTNTGAVSITNLDGRNYAGTVTINTADRTMFSGGMPSTSGPTTALGLNGAFMRGASGPVGEMLGVFSVTGAGYTGAGTFAATK